MLSCRISRLLVVAVWALSSPLIAYADQKDTLLLRHKSWEVTLVEHDNGIVFCTASTFSASGQLLNLASYADSSVQLSIIDVRWRLTPRPVRFFIDVDYSRWDLQGQAKPLSVELNLPPNNKAIAFLEEVAEGTALAMLNTDERRLAVFSLAGSKAALLKLLDCQKTIKSQARDPFKTEDDPL